MKIAAAVICLLLTSLTVHAGGSSSEVASTARGTFGFIELIKPNKVDEYFRRLYLSAGIEEHGSNLCETLNTENYERIYSETVKNLPELANFTTGFVQFYKDKLTQSKSITMFGSKPIAITIRPGCLVMVGGNAMGLDAMAGADTNDIIIRLETSEKERSSQFPNLIIQNKTVLAHELGHLLHFAMGVDYGPLGEAIADFFSYLYTGETFAGVYPNGNGYTHLRDFKISSANDLNKVKKGTLSFIVTEADGIQGTHLIASPFRDALIQIAEQHSPQDAFNVVAYIGKTALLKKVNLRAKQIQNPNLRSEFMDKEYRALISEALKNYRF